MTIAPAPLSNHEINKFHPDALLLMGLSRDQRRSLLNTPEIQSPRNDFEREVLQVLEHAQAIDRLADWYMTQEKTLRNKFITRTTQKLNKESWEGQLLTQLSAEDRTLPALPKKEIDERARAIFAKINAKAVSYHLRRFAGREIAKIDRARKEEKSRAALDNPPRRSGCTF